MSTVITVRVKPEELPKIDGRAAQLGQDRSGYVRHLIAEDLKTARKPKRHRFASEDLVGCISTGIKCGDNATIRTVIRNRLLARGEKHR
jgi:hypothetical protein